MTCNGGSVNRGNDVPVIVHFQMDDCSSERSTDTERTCDRIGDYINAVELDGEHV